MSSPFESSDVSRKAMPQQRATLRQSEARPVPVSPDQTATAAQRGSTMSRTISEDLVLNVNGLRGDQADIEVSQTSNGGRRVLAIDVTISPKKTTTNVTQGARQLTGTPPFQADQAPNVAYTVMTRLASDTLKVRAAASQTARLATVSAIPDLGLALQYDWDVSSLKKTMKQIGVADEERQGVVVLACKTLLKAALQDSLDGFKTYAVNAIHELDRENMSLQRLTSQQSEALKKAESEGQMKDSRLNTAERKLSASEHEVRTQRAEARAQLATVQPTGQSGRQAKRTMDRLVLDLRKMTKEKDDLQALVNKKIEEVKALEARKDVK